MEELTSQQEDLILEQKKDDELIKKFDEGYGKRI